MAASHHHLELDDDGNAHCSCGWEGSNSADKATEHLITIGFWKPEPNNRSRGRRTSRHMREKARKIRHLVIERHGLRCHWCGRALRVYPPAPGNAERHSDAMTIDHVKQLRDGGTSELENLVPACKSCNGRRGAGEALGHYRCKQPDCPGGVVCPAWRAANCRSA